MTDQKPTGVFVRLHDGMLNEKQVAALCNPKRSSTENILAIGTPVTGGEIDYEATVAHYEGKLAEKDAEIVRLKEALIAARSSIASGSPMKAAYTLDAAMKGTEV